MGLEMGWGAPMGAGERSMGELLGCHFLVAAPLPCCPHKKSVCFPSSIFIERPQLSEFFSRQQLMFSGLISEVSSLFWESISRGRFLSPFSCLVTRATQFPHAVPESSGEALWLLSLFYITRTKADWQFSPLFSLSLHLKLLLPFLALLPHLTSMCSRADHAAGGCDTSWSPGSAAASMGTGQRDSSHPPWWQAECVGLGDTLSFY